MRRLFYAYGMLADMSKQELETRRERLRALISELQRELSVVEGRLNRLNAEPGVRLDRAFFWESVLPHLMCATRPLTTSEIRARLTHEGLHIDAARLRTFLSRAHQRGWVSMEKMSSGIGKWAVGDAALQASTEEDLEY